MTKVLKYTLFDLTRSWWSYLYFGFFFLFTGAMLMFSNDTSRVVISLMNVVLILCPLVATMFGVMYSYSNREFIELLLAQPLQRWHIFLGQYLGLAISLSAGLVLGIVLPVAVFGFAHSSGGTAALVVVTAVGVMLTFVFSGLAFLIALKCDNRIKGFGLALLSWLFFAVIYDGIVLLLLMIFRDYPLERLTLFLSVLNPIDLSRILILLKLDISALMGYTGAVFEKFFGTGTGVVLSALALLLWTTIPVWALRRQVLRKDF